MLWTLLEQEPASDACIEDWTRSSKSPLCVSLSDVLFAADQLSKRLRWSPHEALPEHCEASPPRGEVVSILVDAGVELVIGMLAAVRSGRPFLLLDPVLPADRLQYQIQDTLSGTLLIPSERPQPSWLSKDLSIVGHLVIVSIHVDTLLERGLSLPVSGANDGDGSDQIAISTEKSAIAYVCYTRCASLSWSLGFPCLHDLSP